MPTKIAHPQRVQARRQPNYRAVHRPTRWGNPFAVDTYGHERALALYARWLDEQLHADPSFLEPLRGYNLGCLCGPDEPCHADILLERLYGTRPDAPS